MIATNNKATRNINKNMRLRLLSLSFNLFSTKSQSAPAVSSFGLSAFIFSEYLSRKLLSDIKFMLYFLLFNLIYLMVA